MEIAVFSSPEFHINLQFLLIIRSPGVHTGKESQCKSLSPTAAALSLLNQSKVKLELCSLAAIERLWKGILLFEIERFRTLAEKQREREREIVSYDDDY
ncbi:hypothetical protein C5167_023219 [Papaver somniferum]|uniref:Uncharacterized protein n=1 Tax=Papaver somniferum TaxID=3469 RepID=A0A4Y7JNT3_PAPSO|nr:hypothetical protein C5167_023219 [Papaver somniferum]